MSESTNGTTPEHAHGETVTIPREEYEYYQRLEGRIESIENRIDDLQAEVRGTRNHNKALSLKNKALREVVLGERELGEDGIENADDVFTRLTKLAEAAARHDDLLETITNIESGKTSKEGKVSQIVTFAGRKRDPDQEQIVITASDICGCTGVSRRYAYDLIDDISNRYDWAGVRDAKAVKTGKNGRPVQKKKGLVIDFTEFTADEGCELVHHTDGAKGGI